MRRAWVMQLKPGFADEYKRRHDAIWPELTEAIRARGITSFSIYRHGLTLFAYQEYDPAVPAMEPAPVMRRWWREMAELMETEADLQPARVMLEEVFHLGPPSA
jgi:L-rhamnose mutarotase